MVSSFITQLDMIKSPRCQFEEVGTRALALPGERWPPWCGSPPWPGGWPQPLEAANKVPSDQAPKPCPCDWGHGFGSCLMAVGVHHQTSSHGNIFPLQPLQCSEAAPASLQRVVVDVWQLSRPNGMMLLVCMIIITLTHIHKHIPYHTMPYHTIPVHTYIRTYVRTSIHPYIHTSIHAYMHTCIHTCIHAYMHTYIHTYLPTYILHTYIMWCIYIYI